MTATLLTVCALPGCEVPGSGCRVTLAERMDADLATQPGWLEDR